MADAPVSDAAPTPEAAAPAPEAPPAPDYVAEIDRLKSELKTRDEAAAAAEVKRAEEAGEYRRLYEEGAARLAEAEAENATFQAAVAARNERRLKALPEALAGLVPDGMTGAALDTYLDKAESYADRFRGPVGTVSRTGAPAPAASAEVLEFAARYGVDDPAEATKIHNAYKRRKKRIGGL